METDVLIVGAGPAGSTLASLLARRGIQVTLVDRARFPRVKPCGETLNPGAVRVLNELGFLDDVMARGPARIAGWNLECNRGQGAVGLYQSGQIGLGLPRRDLDDVLLRHATLGGATVMEGTQVFAVQRRLPSGFEVDCRRDGGRANKIRTRLLIGADGLRSIVSRQLGMVGRTSRLRKFSITCRLRGHAPTGVGALHLLDKCTVGLAPVHRSQPLWNGTVVMPSSAWSGPTINVLDTYTDCLSQATRDWDVAPEVVDGPWTSGPFDRPVRSVAVRDALLIGDAAGYFDPLTGQGVFQALRTAQLAADAIEKVWSDSERQPHAFATYARCVRREQRWTRLFQRGVENVLSHQVLRGFALGHLAKRPGYMDRLVRFAGDAMPVGGLARMDLLAMPQVLR